MIQEIYYGTIKYIGEVQGSTGNWVGLRWDDPRRGKHDGEHNGIYFIINQVLIQIGKRYFTCEAGRGSFARAEKLNFGVSLSQALQMKYVLETEQEGIVPHNY